MRVARRDRPLRLRGDGGPESEADDPDRRPTILRAIRAAIRPHDHPHETAPSAIAYDRTRRPRRHDTPRDTCTRLALRRRQSRQNVRLLMKSTVVLKTTVPGKYRASHVDAPG